MLDDLSIVVSIQPPKEVIQKLTTPFQFKGIWMSPRFSNNLVIKYSGQWRNLRITIHYDTMIVCNSWHKFFHDNNHGDYSFQEIIKTIEIFTQKFGQSILSARIQQATIGCNLLIDAAEILEKVVSQGNYKFLEMSSFTTSKLCYGKYVKKNRTKFKIYNKQWEVKRHDRLIIPQTLRIELEMNMKYMQNLTSSPIRLFTLEDLLSNAWIEQARLNLIKQVNQIVFDQTIPLEEGDKMKDLIVKRYMDTSRKRNELKAVVTPKTFRGYVRTYKQIIENYSHKDLNMILGQMICQKFKELELIDGALNTTDHIIKTSHNYTDRKTQIV